jgi:FtsH-binding integral membrane protein
MGLKEWFILLMKLLIGGIGITAIIISFLYPFQLKGLFLSGIGVLLVIGLLIYEMNKGGDKSEAGREK